MNFQARNNCARVKAFVKGLDKTPGDGLFNPWFERDRHNDVSEQAPDIRRCQLIHYLTMRLGRARCLLIAEAAGYQGAHFSGIAMTSERILLGHKKKDGILPCHVLPGLKPRRTSSSKNQSLAKTVHQSGFTEPTATTVWRTLLALGMDSRDFVLWNAVPWHPYDPNKGLLSNRTPTENEQDGSRCHLENFLDLYPGVLRIAVGKVSQDLLSDYGFVCRVRHPSFGGVPKFRTCMEKLIGMMAS